MLRLDILSILITLFLVDIYSWKKVLLASLCINFITLVFLMFLKIEFSFFYMAGVFTYVEATSRLQWLVNFVPFFISMILAKSLHRETIAMSLLIPWEYDDKWYSVFYKLAYYGLLYQIIRIILRG